MPSGTSKPREMAQIPYRGKTPQNSIMWPTDEIPHSLLDVTSKPHKPHKPIAPSPLNPTLCESDIIRGRHFYQLRKTRPVTRRAPEISPTLRFLKRKAYFEYQAHAAHRNAHKIVRAYSLQGEECNAVTEPDLDENSADVTDGENMPATFIVESGPLIQIVHFDYPRHGAAVDIEKQVLSHRPLPRWQTPRQRLKLFLLLFLMSACLTLLTVFALSTLRQDRYFSG